MTPELTVDVIIAAGTWVAIGGAVYAVRKQVVASQRLTGLQIYLQLFQHYESPYMHQKRTLFARRLLDGPHTGEIDDTVLAFFETLGYLNRRELVETEFVWNSFGMDACMYWAATKRHVEEMQKLTGDITLYGELEQLRNRIALFEPWYRNARKAEARNPSEDSIRRFLLLESKRASSEDFARIGQLG